jgi:hypothetical protein
LECPLFATHHQRKKFPEQIRARIISVFWFLISKGTFNLDFYLIIYFDGTSDPILRLVLWISKTTEFQSFSQQN